MANGPFYAEGRYEGQVTSQGFVAAKSSGNMQFVLRFKIMAKVESPSTTSPVAQQYERTMYRTITDKTMDYFMQDLEALGVTISSFEDLAPGGSADLAGQVADFYCKHEQGQDGMREKWSVAFNSKSEPVQSAPASEVKALDRLFGKHLKKPNGAPPIPSRLPQPAARVLEVTDDDVPF